MDVAKFREMFLAEAADHLYQMTTVLVTLEADPDSRSGIDALFRNAHSIKGMAGTMAFGQTAALAHHLEDILDTCRQAGHIDQDSIDRVLTGVDLLETLLTDIRSGDQERDISAFLEENGSSDPINRQEAKVTEAEPVLIELDKPVVIVKLLLDPSTPVSGARMLLLLKELGELGRVVDSRPSEQALLAGNDGKKDLVVRLETSSGRDDIAALLNSYSEVKEVSFPEQFSEPVVSPGGTSSAGTTTVRVNTDLLDSFINLTGELITTRYHLQSAVKQRRWSDVDDGVGQLTRLVKNLQHQVLQVRMLSLENLFIRVARTVRELARSSGKEIELQLDGAAIEIDRAIVEELTAPLIHLVRNAIDHGISEQGRVSVKAWRERDLVMVEVADDGCGIDPRQIKEKALERGLLNEQQLQALSDYDAIQLICLPGFSTAGKITETSGRGVGMDVVKTAVEQVGGLLEIVSAPGEGTRFIMKLPLSLAIVRVLLVSVAGVSLALPISRVVQTLEITRDEIQRSGRQRVIEFKEKVLPLLSLRKILNYPKAQLSEPLPVVVTEVLGRRVGLVVDTLIGQREVFVQRMPTPFDQLKGCSGATMLGNGHIVFVLDLQSLLEKIRG